jgi:hypothetical protein
MSLNLARAVFDSRDMAYMLSIPNYTDHERNWNREGFLNVPRPRKLGRGGAEFVLAHAYEQGILFDLICSKVPRELAAAVVKRFFLDMLNGHEASNRISKLDRDKFEALQSATGEYSNEEDPFHFGLFVQFPEIYFMKDLMKPNPKSPLFLVFNGQGHLRLVKGSESLGQAHADLWKDVARRYADPNHVEPFFTIHTVNLTGLIELIQHRLTSRLIARVPLIAE